MLRRSMGNYLGVYPGLDDLLGDLKYARRQGDLGRLALLAYCEVRRWARQAREAELAASSLALITDSPPPTRSEFLYRVDGLIAELEEARERLNAQAGSLG
jgi:hypothetical protein